MKKYFRFTLLTLAAALLFTACSNEEEIANGGTPNIEGGITFTFPTAKAGTTYATTPGIGLENNIDLTKTTILMFNADTDPVLEAIYKGVGTGEFEIKSGGTAANPTVTVVVPADKRTGKKTFYFVVNNETAPMTTLALGQPLSTVKDQITTDQPTPQGMRNDKTILMGGNIVVNDIATESYAGKLTLKRRVARFDIKNTYDDVTIVGVRVSSSKTNAYVLPINAANTTPTSAVKFDLTTAEQTATKEVTNGLQSVFYLYPDAGTETRIQIEAAITGVTEHVILSIPQRAIVANTRYIITAHKNNGEIGFTLEAAPWDTSTDTETILAQAGAPIVTGFAFAAGNEGDVPALNVDARSYHLVDYATSVIIKVTTLSATKEGASIELIKELGDRDVTVTEGTTSNTITYGAAGYAQTHTITIPAYSGGADDFSNLIIIKDRAAGVDAPATTISLWDNKVTGSVFYPGTRLKPVVVGGVTWAPVNVGATTLNGTTKISDMGLLYQWGRNHGFIYEGNYNTVTGPVAYTDVEVGGQYENTFIITAKDWLKSDDSSISTRNSKWMSTAGPCPSGWRVATDTELSLISSELKSSGIYDAINNRFEIPASNGSKFYLPIAGVIARTTGLAAGRTWTGLWSAKYGTQGILTSFDPKLSKDKWGSTYTDNNGNAFSVRCVKAN